MLSCTLTHSQIRLVFNTQIHIHTHTHTKPCHTCPSTLAFMTHSLAAASVEITTYAHTHTLTHYRLTHTHSYYLTHMPGYVDIHGLHTRLDTQRHAHTCMHTHKHVHTCIHTNTYTHAYTQTRHTNTYTHADTHAHTCPGILTFMAQ